jgi:hypothetical protein
MPTTTKRIQTLDVNLQAQPGALAQVYNAFRETGVDVIASWGYEMGPNQAQAHFYVADQDKAKATLTKMGLKPKFNNACWIEGENKVGAYAEVLAKLAKANINIGATDAFGVGNRFASVIFTADAKDFEKLCKTLNI